MSISRLSLPGFPSDNGVQLWYLPFPAKYVPVIERLAAENNVDFHSIHITDRDMAQNAPTPITNYALFRDGHYVSNEILSEKKFLKMIGRG